MQTKVIQFIPAVLVMVVIGFRYFSQWCTNPGQICYRTWVEQIIPTITYPLYFFALYLLPLTIILIFIPRNLFNSWLKFAAVAIPVAIIYIWTTHVSSSAYMDFFPFYRDDAARVAGIAFTVLSLAFIAIKSFLLRGK